MADARDTPSAPTTTTNDGGPSLEEAFVADRMTFWNRFTQFTTYSVIVMVVLLIGMYIFIA